MYQSNLMMSIAYVLIVCCILGIVLRKEPIAVTYHAAKNVLQNKKSILLLVLMGCIMVWNNVELMIEEKWITISDFSPSFYNIEGDFVATVQKTFYHPMVTQVTTFFYVIVFTSVFFTTAIIYAYQKDNKTLHNLLVAIFLNYLIAVPFYLFFPVNEVWSVKENVRFLIPDVFTTFESTYRNMSGINNCFPSLHTSLSVTVFLVALQQNNRILKWITGITTGIIIFSIFYLGIHWLIDSIGGILLACSAVHLAKRINQTHKLKEGVRHEA